MKDEPFTIISGETIRGEVTFWKSGKSYFYQCIGIGEPKRCSKKLYDEAKALHEKQKAGVENE